MGNQNNSVKKYNITELKKREYMILEMKIGTIMEKKIINRKRAEKILEQEWNYDNQSWKGSHTRA